MKTFTHPERRHRAALLARTACAVSALAFTVGVAGGLATDVRPAAAAPIAGVARIIEPLGDGSDPSRDPLTSGGSDTDFALSLPTGAACTGDTSNDNYQIMSYMIAGSADPATLEFTTEGPEDPKIEPPLATFRAPLFDITGSAVASKPTAPADPAPGPGPIVNLPDFDLQTISVPDVLVAQGAYNIGIACWHGVTPTHAVGELDKFWNARIAVTVSGTTVTWTALAAPTATTVTLEADPEDEAAEGDTVTLTAAVTPDDAEGTITFLDDGDPLGAAVTVTDGAATLEVDDLALGDHVLHAAFAPATGTSFAPSTSADLAYTISEDGATSTSSSSTSSTTGGSSTTSTTTAGGATSSTTSTTAAAGGAPRTGVSPGNLARTGFSFSIAVWGLLALAFGRMAVLLSRPIRVPGS